MHSARLAQQAGTLVRSALRSPNPPRAGGNVATLCVLATRAERSTRKILLRHSHKPASCKRTYSATASGLANLKNWLLQMHSAPAGTTLLARLSHGWYSPTTLFLRQFSEMSPDEIKMSQRGAQKSSSLLLRGETAICCNASLVGAPQTQSTPWSCPHAWRCLHGAAMLPRLQRRPLQPCSVPNRNKCRRKVPSPSLRHGNSCWPPPKRGAVPLGRPRMRVHSPSSTRLNAKL